MFYRFREVQNVGGLTLLTIIPTLCLFLKVCIERQESLFPKRRWRSFIVVYSNQAKMGLHQHLPEKEQRSYIHLSFSRDHLENRQNRLFDQHEQHDAQQQQEEARPHAAPTAAADRRRRPQQPTASPPATRLLWFPHSAIVGLPATKLQFQWFLSDTQSLRDALQPAILHQHRSLLHAVASATESSSAAETERDVCGLAPAHASGMVPHPAPFFAVGVSVHAVWPCEQRESV